MNMRNLLSVSDLAAVLGLSPQTIYNRRSNGEDLPPAIKCGGQIRFDPDDVAAWFQRNKEQADTTLQMEPYCEKPRRRRGRPTKAESLARQRAATAH